MTLLEALRVRREVALTSWSNLRRACNRLAVHALTHPEVWPSVLLLREERLRASREWSRAWAAHCDALAKADSESVEATSEPLP